MNISSPMPQKKHRDLKKKKATQKKTNVLNQIASLCLLRCVVKSGITSSLSFTLSGYLYHLQAIYRPSALG